MKKLALLSLWALGMMSLNTNAQSKTEQIFEKYRFGIFVGPTFNAYKPTATTDNKYTITKEGGNVGFTFGINAELNLNERYTVFSGLGLDWRGGKVKATHDSTAVTAEYLRSTSVVYKHQYLTIPIGIKMKAAEFDKIKIFAQTGLDLGLLLSQKGSYTAILSDSANTVSKSPEKQKLKDYAQAVPVNLGWSIGVGAEYELSEKNSVYGAIIYRNGFTDATTPKSNIKNFKFSDGNIRSNSIAIRIGYYF
jgi:opacity protein-like surface antigen